MEQATNEKVLSSLAGAQSSSAKIAEPPSNMPSNFHALILNRNSKKPLTTKNSSQVPSTPSNIKRLQVEKWFNSPTDKIFSPCTTRLENMYKKTFPLPKCDLTEELLASPADGADQGQTSTDTISEIENKPN